jgi:L-glyceraldehyde 3-phosphate reductase
MMALDQIVRSGKALYAGISNYPAELAKKAAQILRKLGTPCLIHQPRHSMFDRWIENGLLDVTEEEGMGVITFSPLAQGLLTDKYINGVPEGSRAAKNHGHLQKDQITEETIKKVKALHEMAQGRNQSLAQMALAWNLKDQRITSVLIGASSEKQLQNNLATLNNLHFDEAELKKIEEILNF